MATRDVASRARALAARLDAPAPGAAHEGHGGGGAWDHYGRGEGRSDSDPDSSLSRSNSLPARSDPRLEDLQRVLRARSVDSAPQDGPSNSSRLQRSVTQPVLEDVIAPSAELLTDRERRDSFGRSVTHPVVCKHGEGVQEAQQEDLRLGAGDGSCISPLQDVERGVYQPLSMEQISAFREAFTALDPDGRGWISRAELGALFRRIGLDARDEELGNVLARMDLSGDGRINCNEFLALVASSFRDEMGSSDLKRTFETLDLDGDGFLVAADLGRLMFSMGEELTPQELDQMLARADLDKDGRLSLAEFAALVNTPPE